MYIFEITTNAISNTNNKSEKIYKKNTKYSALYSSLASFCKSLKMDIIFVWHAVDTSLLYF